MELNPRKAYCTYPIAEKSFYWDDTNKYENKTYWEARPETIRIPVSTYVEYKTFWIKYCKKNNQCSDKDIASWDKKQQKLMSVQP
jgi:hypothetical protein